MEKTEQLVGCLKTHPQCGAQSIGNGRQVLLRLATRCKGELSFSRSETTWLLKRQTICSSHVMNGLVLNSHEIPERLVKSGYLENTAVNRDVLL